MRAPEPAPCVVATIPTAIRAVLASRGSSLLTSRRLSAVTGARSGWTGTWLCDQLPPDAGDEPTSTSVPAVYPGDKCRVRAGFVLFRGRATWQGGCGLPVTPADRGMRTRHFSLALGSLT